MGDREWARPTLWVLVRLSPWVLGAVLIGVVLARTDLGAAEGLFQSGVATATATATAVPATPTITATPSALPSPLPTTAVTPTLTATSQPISPTETATPAPTPLPTATEVVPAAPTEPAQPTASPLPSEGQRYPQQQAHLKFNWGMLFDSLALGVSYLWLACGILLFLGAVPLFVYLWVAGRRRRPEE